MRKIIFIIWTISILFFVISVPYLYFSSLKSSDKSLKIKGRTFIETISPSIINSIKFSVEIDRNVSKELNLLSEVLLEERVNKAKLLEYSVQFDLFGITVMDKNNIVINSTLHMKDEKIDEREIIKGMNTEINGDTMFFYKEKGNRKLLILKDISSIKLLKREYGIKSLLNEISKDPEIEFFLFQSKEGVVFSSKLPERVLDIDEDTFLKNAFNSDSILTREILNKNKRVFEFLKSVEIFGEKEGILRVGFSMDKYMAFVKSFNVFFIITLVLIFFYLIVYFAYFNNLKKYTEAREKNEIIEIFEKENNLFLIIVREDGKIVFANHAIQSFLGDSNLKDKNILEKDELDIFKIKKVMEQKREIKFEEKIGKRIFAGRTIPIIHGRNKFILGLLADITEIKETYREEKLSGFTEFLAGLAHEIKNPLNLMALSIKELEKSADSKVIKKIEGAYLNLKEKVEEFLLYLRPFGIEKKEFNLTEIFKEIEKEKSELLKKHGIIFKVEGKELKVISDYKKLKKILDNIVKNSIEAQEEGGIIEISTEKINDKIKINISDRGTGIPEDEIEKIFSPFYTRKEKGTGLGLFIVKKLIEDIQGKIEISSKPGFGTTVEILIPEKL